MQSFTVRDEPIFNGLPGFKFVGRPTRLAHARGSGQTAGAVELNRNNLPILHRGNRKPLRFICGE